jgi:hypothetical protein
MMGFRIIESLLLVVLTLAQTSTVAPPQLQIHDAGEFTALRARFEASNANRLAGIAELVGVPEPGPAIEVTLASESSEVAQRTPDWIAGFARDATNQIVIFPSRSVQYPHQSLDDVLRHEVAHILIARASGGQAVPRWFNEGLAMAAERSWRFEDQTRLFFQIVLGPAPGLMDIERWFRGGETNQGRAYALSGALVRDLLEQHGQNAGAGILAGVRRGATFDQAFRDTTGMTPGAAESDFFQRQRVWTTWVPIVTSSAAIWIIVTFIALAAIRRRRKRDVVLREKWEQEDREENR